MKVSIVVGGRWHAFDLARELHAAGYLHRLITNYPKFKTRQWGIPDEKVVSLPLSFILSKFIHKISGESFVMNQQFFLHNLFAVQASQYLEGSSLIHGWSSFSEPSILWAKKRDIPFILERSSAHMTVQCQLLREEYSNLGLTWHETHPKIVAQELREYDLADRVAVPSLFVKRTFIERNFPEDKIVYNSFGTNLQNFFPAEKTDKIFRVIFTGGKVVRKGIHYLVSGFQETSIPHSELLLVGGFSEETKRLVQGKLENIKLIDHVPQKELVNFYHQADVFVMPSIEEGMAMVQLQAFGCGLPLICTTNTGGEDLLRMSGAKMATLENNIEEYPAGFLIPIRDSKAIATCLQILANNPDKLKAKKESALSLRDQNTTLDWSSYAQRAINAYKSLH
jgi:starch synthase